MKQQVEVCVFRNSELTDIPNNPKDFLAYWQEFFDEVPEQYRATTVIELQAVESYGDASIECSIYYTREETLEEEQKREARIATAEERMKQSKMRQYLELQKELGLDTITKPSI